MIGLGIAIGYIAADAYARWNQPGWSLRELAENGYRNFTTRRDPRWVGDYLAFIDALPTTEGGE